MNSSAPAPDSQLPTPAPKAYLGVPDLPIQVERRRRGELRGRPVMVLSGGGEGGRALVEAASDEARAVGVAAGMTRRQAEHLCPEVAGVLADPPAYEAAFEALLAALGSCTPTVQPLRAGYGAELDVAGLELLFGPAPALAKTLLRQAARVRLRARAGLGPNRLVARLAAGAAAAGDFVVVAPSDARAFLYGLSVQGLPLSAESRERLELLGVRTFGQLLKLPRAGLGRQVGPDALALARAAEADGELLAAHRPAEWLVAETDVDGPLETREQLLRLLEPLADRLVTELRERYLGAGAVRLRLAPGPPGPGLPSPPSPFPAREGGAGGTAHLLERTASLATILEAALHLVGQVVGGEEEEARLPEWVELALGELGPLTGRQDGLFEGQGQRRRQAAEAVEELAARFRGRLLAPAFVGRRRPG